MNEIEVNADLALADWKATPVPDIVLTPDVAASGMGRTVGEAAIWPQPDDAWNKCIPLVLVENQAETAVTWIRSIIREEFIPENLTSRLIAVPKIFGGEDAFLVVWSVDKKPLRIAVTRDRLHVLSLLEPDFQTSGDMQQVQESSLKQAITFANTVMQLPTPLNEQQLQTRSFGGAILCTSPHTSLPAWHESLILLIQDRTVKASVLLKQGGGSPIQRGGPRGEPIPWFPVP